MVRRLRSLILTSAFLTGAAPAAADIVADMQQVTAFCLRYVETGQATDLLEKAGFTQSGRKFKKSYNAGLIGGTKPVISVDPRKSRAGYGCSGQFSIIARSDAAALFDAAVRTLRKMGYQDTVVATPRGKRIPAFAKEGVAVQLGGSTTASHGSYSTLIYLQRL